jgi:hypothetical protein
MTLLPPWADGPFELLLHAESHLRLGEDFDRRIALISFDNAIEVAITTYLTLHPIQRGNRHYKKVDVEKWLDNYHSRLEFLAEELTARRLNWEVEQSHIVWAHEQRNEQYHGGNKGVPDKKCLNLIRRAALWIFGKLFDIVDPEKELEDALLASVTPPPPEPVDGYDRAIDDEYGMIQIGDQTFYASEVLFAVDYGAYKEAGLRLTQSPPPATTEEAQPWAN